MRPNLPALSLTAVMALGATTARAQTDNAAAVESLFADGKRLMAEGKTADACTKFLASYNLEHRVGTLLNLANCYEKNGQLASAWARYIEVRTLATRAGQSERAALASERVSALEPRRSVLTIAVDHPPAGLVVRRDGVVVDPAVYGVAVPVDGGAHTVESTAPGAKPVKATVTIGAERDEKTFAVVLPTPDSAPATKASPSSSPGSTQRILGVGIGVAGLVGLGVGAGFGASASSSWSQSQSECASATSCTDRPAAVSQHDSANSAAMVSTVGFVAGGVLLATGVVMFLTAPRGHAATTTGGVLVVPSVERAGAGVALSGRF